MGRLIDLLIIILTSFVCFGAVIPSPGTREKEQAESLKILTYNIRNCVGLDKVADYQRIADVIKRIDAGVVAIQEVDSATSRSKNVVVLNELATRTNMFATYSSSIDFQGGKYGVGILTREKPVSWQKVSLPGKEEKRSLLIVELKNFVICCTHLSLTKDDRLTSAEIICEAARKYSKPVFLAGDLNSEPGSVELNSLQKEWLMLNNPLEPTFPADKPNKCIDFILVRKIDKDHIDVFDSKVEIENTASDHRPVWVSISLKK